MKKELKEMLINGLKDLDIDIDELQVKAFDLYLNELIKWNSKYNLTAITDEKEIIIKHFIDSAIICKKQHCKYGEVIDIGSGAGFPGIILKILVPGMHLTSVDANEKKIFFQKNVVRKINFNHIHLISERVEDSSFIREYKNYFDCAVVRAFKSVSNILTLSYPIVKKGGKISIFKGRNFKKDIEGASENGMASRFDLIKVDSYRLPYINRLHHILVYQKK